MSLICASGYCGYRDEPLSSDFFPPDFPLKIVPFCCRVVARRQVFSLLFCPDQIQACLPWLHHSFARTHRQGKHVRRFSVRDPHTFKELSMLLIEIISHHHRSRIPSSKSACEHARTVRWSPDLGGVSQGARISLLA